LPTLVSAICAETGCFIPAFRQMDAEGRILHCDWSLYDTGHPIFRPRHMTPEELERSYAWIY